ncbi:MAG: pyridoxamine 5'-phosphate oxidase family protein [Anaerolineae bacterium]|nr:pyridoxamine 5'-phosphate oxidase family protein [Anaerolineae bacterium]
MPPNDKNTKKYAQNPRDEIRRADKMITDPSWINALLHRGAYGTVATSHNDQPFLNPTLYVYDASKEAIYFHSANVGRTRANIELNPNVCFSVTEMGRVLPNQNAINFNVEYNSVIIFGRAAVINSIPEATRVLQMLMEKYAPHLHPGEDYDPIPPEDVKRTTVYQIQIEQTTAKQQAGAADHPQAFTYTPTQP